MPDIEIASFEDLDRIVDLLESVNVPTEGIHPGSTRFFIIRNESYGKIIGCIGLELFNGSALLRSFAVNPKHQGKRIGTWLIERILEEALEAGSDAVYLCTTKAPQLFLNIGFLEIELDEVPEEIKRSELFMNISPIGAAYLKKNIN
jgi:N-acetylglutamate synthase-like GNAT family acetyltransferase